MCLIAGTLFLLAIIVGLSFGVHQIMSFMGETHAGGRPPPHPPHAVQLTS